MSPCNLFFHIIRKLVPSKICKQTLMCKFGEILFQEKSKTEHLQSYFLFWLLEDSKPWIWIKPGSKMSTWYVSATLKHTTYSPLIPVCQNNAPPIIFWLNKETTNPEYPVLPLQTGWGETYSPMWHILLYIFKNPNTFADFDCDCRMGCQRLRKTQEDKSFFESDLRKVHDITV